MTTKQINRAINERIEEALQAAGLAVPLVDEDLAEPIRRPSIKVEIGEGNAGRWGSCCSEHNLTVRIYFFAKNRYRPKGENTVLRELIENAFFEDLIVAGGAIPIETVTSAVSDGVLTCTMDLYRVELLPDTDNRPPMETLSFRKG